MASHESNPLSITRVIVDSYPTLGHMGGSNSCGGYTLMRVPMTRWQMGLSSTQAKVEAIVPRAGVETAMSLTIPLGNQASPHCM